MPVTLSRDEIDQFHFQGYLGPYPAISPEDMAVVREELFNNIFNTDGPNPYSPTHSRHLDQPVVYDVLSQPAIVQRIAHLIGEDVMLWTCGFFIKEPHGEGKATEWHQDINYWPLEPQVNITAWIAVDDVYEDNAPLQVIPGSHRKMLPHIKSADTLGQEADPALFDASQARKMICKAGEFILFSERLLHGSAANTSTRRRTGMVARYTMPLVRLFTDHSPIKFDGYHALMVSGRDRFGFNPIGSPPR